MFKRNIHKTLPKKVEELLRKKNELTPKRKN